MNDLCVFYQMEYMTSKLMLSGSDGLLSNDLRKMDPETQARLETLLEAAGTLGNRYCYHFYLCDHHHLHLSRHHHHHFIIVPENIHLPHRRDFSYDPPPLLDFPKSALKMETPFPSADSIFVAHPLEILSFLVEI